MLLHGAFDHCVSTLSGLMAAVDAAVLSVTRPEIEVLIQGSKWGSRRLSLVKQEITRSPWLSS